MSLSIRLVEKIENDGRRILTWRNDETTRNNSFNQKVQHWEKFQDIFYNNYFNHILQPLFVTSDNIDIAVIGFCETDHPNEFNISINVGPAYRGKGLSVPIIRLVTTYLKKLFPFVVCINAEIKASNIASIKAFSRSGFTLKSKSYKHSTPILAYTYRMVQCKFSINERTIDEHSQTYFIAELSCNHNQDKSVCFKLIDEAHKAGADAVKLQTYTADTMTIKCDKPLFKDCLNGTLWEGQTLHELYQKAYTPWEWHKELKEYANKLGMDLFTSPFDTTAVDFLETLDMPAYKIASFEITDHILIKRIAQTGKPVIISSGMASLSELNDAVSLLRQHGTTQICMLKCTSAYPAKPEDANLITIKHMAKTFGIVSGLSDHTLGIEVPIASVLLGARVIEKHFTLSRDSGSPDDAFSLTPPEFKQMIDCIRIVEKTVGKITYAGVNSESSSKRFRRSLFVVEDVKKGDILTDKNVRSIRPSNGLHTRFYVEVIGKTATQDIEKGTPLIWSLFG